MSTSCKRHDGAVRLSPAMNALGQATEGDRIVLSSRNTNERKLLLMPVEHLPRRAPRANDDPLRFAVVDLSEPRIGVAAEGDMNDPVGHLLVPEDTGEECLRREENDIAAVELGVAHRGNVRWHPETGHVHTASLAMRVLEERDDVMPAEIHTEEPTRPDPGDDGQDKDCRKRAFLKPRPTRVVEKSRHDDDEDGDDVDVVTCNAGARGRYRERNAKAHENEQSAR